MENIGPLDVSKHDNDVRTKTKARMMEEKKNEGKRVVGLFVRIYRGHSFFFVNGTVALVRRNATQSRGGNYVDCDHYVV